ncbi:MAG TPA: fimbria/pilus periplasmic chaperone [Dongiaceae bacterium]|nr:fimbria/pilus periplasmic chaperone [Dongiaceae bacterium]
MHRIPLQTVFVCLGLGLALVSARAFTLTPISATLAPAGHGAAASFRVENSSSNRVAFQITMITREMDEDGNETYEPATNFFTVFPPQGIIPAGQRQNIRVVWKGPTEVTNELAYRIVAEELPVTLDPEQNESRIKLLVRYMGTVYVTPRRAKAELQLVSLTKVAPGTAGTNNYVLTLRNAGTAHQGLKNPVLKITAAPGAVTTLDAAQLDTVTGQNILARHTRHFPVRLPEGFTADSYPAEIKVDE